ncbi:MAG: DivIVA domain-containing protein, partial [Agrococcus casei]
MALSPDDLLTKRFEETRFRDGYDQEEVDDYLDEIATQWRELIAERDRLAAEVEQLKQGGAQPAAAEAPAAADEAQQSEAAQSAGLVEGSGAASNEFSPSADSSASLLAMAQRLHDEHVMSGEIRRDELISEAEGKRDLLIS